MRIKKEETIARYWLGTINGVSCRKKLQLVERAGSACRLKEMTEEWITESGILTAREKALFAKSDRKNAAAGYERLSAQNIQYYTIIDPEYPERLKDIPSPPFGLFVKGKLPDPNKLSAAIVGTRVCSHYGQRMAEEISKALTGHGVQIISGMARGIDGAAQWAAVEAGGSSYGILGSGVDICYPREHERLYWSLAEQGGLLSEWAPGVPPAPRNFPARNRIISGFADVVLIIEAKGKSGSLITADMALEQGRDVYALPGRVGDPLSEGCNRLIRQGAGIILSVEDLLQELSLQFIKYDDKNKKNQKILETNEDMVYSCLDLQPKNISELLQELPYNSMELSAILLNLELKGYIVEVTRNYYAKSGIT